MNQPSKILKQKARTVLMGKYIPSVSTMITMLALSALLSWLLDMSGFSLAGDTFQKICYVVMNIVILLLEGLLGIGLTYFFLQMALGKPFAGRMLFYCFTHDPDRFILAAALRGSLILLGWLPALICYYAMPVFAEASADQILLLLFLLLLAVLLNLPVRLYFGQSNYILLEDLECGVLESMKRSASLVQGHKARLFFLYLSFVGYNLLEIGTFGAGALWIQPYLEMVQVQFYLNLTGRDPLAEAAEDASISPDDPNSSFEE